MRILYIYRPVFPSYRAQHLQILQSAVALAHRGHHVTIFANKSGPDKWKPPDIPSLNIEFSPFHQPALSSMWFQMSCIRWLQGPKGWIIARDKRRLLRLKTVIPRRHKIALESHELDSLLSPDLQWRSIEQRLLQWIDVLICNCGGTLQLWQQEYDSLPPAFTIHNATSLAQFPVLPPTRTIRSFGSHYDYKAADWLAKSIRDTSQTIEIFGSWNSDTPPPKNIIVQPPVPMNQLSSLLASSQALLLCLGDNIFGRYLSSPLKLWDYLASSRPIIAPSLASIQEIINGMNATGIRYYQPQDKDSFTEACRAAIQDSPRSPSVRTWNDRAIELERILWRHS